MRIGVMAGPASSGGGAYQYFVTLVQELQRLGLDHEFLLFVPEGATVPRGLVTDPTWQVVEMCPRRSMLGRIKHAASLALGGGIRGRLQRIGVRTQEASEGAAPGPLASVGSNTPWADWFAAFDLGFVIYSVVDPLSFEAGVPYIVAVHDLQHRLQPEFPEVSAHGEWKLREFANRNCIGHAFESLDYLTSEASQLVLSQTGGGNWAPPSSAGGPSPAGLPTWYQQPHNERPAAAGRWELT